MCNVDKAHTTPYHLQANKIVERSNRKLDDSLRALLLRKRQNEWDELLPQLMRAYRGIPHSATDETVNFLMFERELRLPDQLRGYSPLLNSSTQNGFVMETQKTLEPAHVEPRGQTRRQRRTSFIHSRRFRLARESKKKRGKPRTATEVCGTLCS